MGRIKWAWPDRYFACVAKSEGCWLWTGSIGSSGYGQFWRNEKNVRAHILALELSGRPRPFEEAQALHSCDVRHCVNPNHLRWGTGTDNMRDAASRGRLKEQKKTHCPKGHEYAGLNLVTDKRGFRTCRSCHNERSNASYHRRKKC